MRGFKGRAAGAISLVTAVLLAGLAGCQVLLPTSEPPATWIPLPTVGPTAAPTLQGRPTEPPTPKATATLAQPTKTPSPSPTLQQLSPDDPLAMARWARDLAWEALIEYSEDPAMPLVPDWRELESASLIGATHYRFENNPWTMTISVPTVLPEDVVYGIEVTAPDGFVWRAQVTPSGDVTIEEPSPTPIPEIVEGWRGTVHALPAGAQFDDFVRLIGGEGGQYGIESRDDDIEAQLVALRDSGRVVRLWGTLIRDVLDYGGTQILVDRLEVQAPAATPVPESELVEGWQGVIRALPAGSAYDDYFDGVSPAGQYGVDALLPQLQDEIVAARETGALLRIWGLMDYGVSDYGGKRIIVTRIESLG